MPTLHQYSTSHQCNLASVGGKRSGQPTQPPTTPAENNRGAGSSCLEKWLLRFEPLLSDRVDRIGQKDLLDAVFERIDRHQHDSTTE